MCLKLVVFFGHVYSPRKFVSLGFVVNFLNWDFPLLDPRKEKDENEEKETITKHSGYICNIDVAILKV